MKQLYLCKDNDDVWYFSLVPFEELDPEDNVLNYPKLENELDSIFEELQNDNN